MAEDFLTGLAGGEAVAKSSGNKPADKVVLMGYRMKACPIVPKKVEELLVELGVDYSNSSSLLFIISQLTMFQNASTNFAL